MIAYIIRSGLMLSLFHLFFILFMKKTTFFRFNRFALMTGSVLCMALPLLDFFFIPESAASYIPHIEIPETKVFGNTAGESGRWNWIILLKGLYFAGTAAVASDCAISILKTFAICRKGEIVHSDGFSITLLEEPIASFSFFRHIAISREDFEQNPLILRHEMIHVENYHSLEIILFSVITALHWFNPLVWMARNNLKEVQEYEADESLLKQGIDATQYQLLLVKKAVGAERFQMANGFNHTKLKNRIKMMQTKKTNRLARLAYIACVPLMLSVLCLCTSQKRDYVSIVENNSSQMLDERPGFNCENTVEFVKWVCERVTYPKSATESGIQGKVVVSFTIDENGNLVDPKIISGVSEELNNEVLRVISSSPKWTPAKENGKAVKCSFIMPFIFTIR